MTSKMPPKPDRRRASRLSAPWHLAWAVPLAAAALAFGSAPGATPVVGQQEPPPSDTVRIQTACIGDGRLGAVTVDPWTVYLPEPTDDFRTNPEVIWVLDDQSPDTDRVEVAPKEPGEWPFPGARHFGQGRGANQGARSGKMLNTLPVRGRRAREAAVQAGNRFSYNIIVFCNVGGEQYEVIIDPDVEVGEGGA